MTLKTLSGITYLLAASAIAGELELSIQRLSAEDFTVRELAHVQLENWARAHPQKSVEKLLTEYKAAQSPEMKQRLLMLLERQVILNKFGMPKGFVGIEMQFAQVEHQGEMLPAVRVGYIFPGSPADRHGLKNGDLIWSVDGRAFMQNKDVTLQFQQRVANKHAGDQVQIDLFRAGEPLEFKLTLMSRTGELPDAELDHRVWQLRREKAAEESAQQHYFDDWLNSHLAAE